MDTNTERSNYDPIFFAPRGRGRPPVENDIPLVLAEFSPGVDTYYDTLISNQAGAFAINNKSQGRTLQKRNGRTLHGNNTDGVNNVYLLDSLNQSGGVDIQLRIINGVTGVKLQKYDYVNDEWDNIGSEWGDADSRIDHFGCNVIINGEERFYFGNGIDVVKYTEGTSVTDVVNGSDDVICKYLTRVENVLVGANWGDIHNPNDVIFCKAGTHQFYKDQDLTLTDTTNKITLDGELTQCVNLGWLVYLFTASDNLWELDLSTGIPRVISTHGTIASKSVATGFDIMIYADQYGVWAKPIGGGVEKISEPIDDIYKYIDANNISQLTGTITPDGLYKLWVGDITYKGRLLRDVNFTFEIQKSRELQQKIWRVWTKKPANRWGNWTNAFGFTNSYMAKRNTSNIYLDDYGTDDEGEDIETFWDSKDFLLTTDKEEYTLGSIYLKAKPDSNENYIVEIKYRSDTGAWDTINSFTVESGTEEMRIYRIESRIGVKGRTLAIELIMNGDVNGEILEAIAYYNKASSEIRPS